MTDREALEAVSRGDKLPQPMVRRLWAEGLIEVSEVTHMQSTEREYIPTLVHAQRAEIAGGLVVAAAARKTKKAKERKKQRQSKRAGEGSTRG
jgi:hypothetical protein